MLLNLTKERYCPLVPNWKNNRAENRGVRASWRTIASSVSSALVLYWHFSDEVRMGAILACSFGVNLSNTEIKCLLISVHIHTIGQRRDHMKVHRSIRFLCFQSYLFFSAQLNASDTYWELDSFTRHKNVCAVLLKRHVSPMRSLPFSSEKKRRTWSGFISASKIWHLHLDCVSVIHYSTRRAHL